VSGVILRQSLSSQKLCADEADVSACHSDSLSVGEHSYIIGGFSSKQDNCRYRVLRANLAFFILASDNFHSNASKLQHRIHGGRAIQDVAYKPLNCFCLTNLNTWVSTNESLLSLSNVLWRRYTDSISPRYIRGCAGLSVSIHRMSLLCDSVGRFRTSNY